MELFHTCRDERRESIEALAPFKARDNGKQWLGVGYYFWVESQEFAEIWGRCSPAYAQHGFLVLKYQLRIDQVDLLDLVGSPNDQRGFQKLMEEFGRIKNIKEKNITVSACVNWFQVKNEWPWLAAKLADNGKEKQLLNRVTKVAGQDLTFLQPRIQLCLYADSADEGIDLSFQGIVYDSPATKNIRTFAGYKKR